jgi:hypothetical protein
MMTTSPWPAVAGDGVPAAGRQTEKTRRSSEPGRCLAALAAFVTRPASCPLQIGAELFSYTDLIMSNNKYSRVTIVNMAVGPARDKLRR